MNPLTPFSCPTPLKEDEAFAIQTFYTLLRLRFYIEFGREECLKI